MLAVGAVIPAAANVFQFRAPRFRLRCQSVAGLQESGFPRVEETALPAFSVRFQLGVVVA